MEVVEINRKKMQPRLPCRKSLECPCNVQCTRRYVQPTRVKSFAPVRTYNPPSKMLEAKTTYHLSYLNVDRAEMRQSRSQPIRPAAALAKSDVPFSAETTNKLSYKLNENISRTKPIIPRQRSMIGSGRMDNVTTIRHDYQRKYVEKPEMIMPCGNIRVSSGQLDASTTAKLSYVDPGPTEPTINFKPITAYCPPSEPIFDDTTHKLSYQPVCIEAKDTCPWQQKPTYKPPDVAMCGKTTYSESYLQNEEPRMEEPVRPTIADVLPHGGEFHGKTIYKESYLELAGKVKRVEPILPCNSISKPGGKVSADTTSKLSYQPVQSEKRAPILPRHRNMLGDGPMQTKTTSRCDFVKKVTLRPELIIPCNNIRNAETAIDDRTTTKMSYVKPDLVESVQSFKPVVQYKKLPEKIECDTVNKLSYQPWTLTPKETVPWAVKGKYQPPTNPMCADTIYHVSYPAPGHYEEICGPENCKDPSCPAIQSEAIANDENSCNQ
ncbi:Protein FAM154B [Habropoda laboriosa]|uniref:Protein FAM154B n=1 Tax=Habropoda laboriosa TaxID=597456 RepID=A0A0L7QKX8_9HYME|nr:Protein FAM154B [Habropoda laboriosa]